MPHVGSKTHRMGVVSCSARSSAPIVNMTRGFIETKAESSLGRPAGSVVLADQTSLVSNTAPVATNGSSIFAHVPLTYELATPLDLNDNDMLTKIVESCTGTKFIARFSDMLVQLALDAVSTVSTEDMGRKEIDIKRYAKVEKIPGGQLDGCRVLKGVRMNKDVTHPKMRRKIHNPRIWHQDKVIRNHNVKIIA